MDSQEGMDEKTYVELSNAAKYLYEKTGNSYSLVSLGADGQEGGEGFDADIRLNDL